MPSPSGPDFKHLSLALHHKGRAKLHGGGGDPNAETQQNLTNRRSHGQRLQMSLKSLRAMWQRLQADRAAQSLPPLPNAMPIFLQVDPGAFDAEQVEKLGLELVMEHERGFLLCAAQDADLKKFEDKINEFISRDDRTMPAKIHRVDSHNPMRAELVIGSSLNSRMTATQAANGPETDITVVLATHGFRNIRDEPSSINPIRNAAVRLEWLAEIESGMQQWTEVFAERAQTFVKFIRKAGGKILDRQDVQLFLSAQPAELRLLAELNPAQVEALATKLERPCPIIARHGAAGSTSAGTESEVLIRIPVTGLQELPPEPDYSNYVTDSERFEEAWEAWVGECGRIRREQWIPQLSALRQKVTSSVGEIGGDIRSLTGDDIDRLQPPDQIVFTARLPLNDIATLCELYPHVVYVDLIPAVSATEAIHAGQSTDPDIPAVLPPPPNAPSICIIDSGIQADHPIIGSTVDGTRCVSFIPWDPRGDYDPASDGGHGTKVAGAVCFPEGMAIGQAIQSIAWLQSARILDEHNQMPAECGAEMTTWKAIRYAARKWGTKIFNLSINYADVMDLHGHARMDSWSSHLDWICSNEDILIIASAGNISPKQFALQRQALQAQANKTYPYTMAQMPCRLTPPALSWNSVVVGSICPDTRPHSATSRIGAPMRPSPFSRGGPGLWKSTKPDVVEVAGDWVEDTNPIAPPNNDQGVMLYLPQSTHGATASKAPSAGTSFAAPKVSRIAAEIARTIPGASPLLMRTLILHSARWPDWMDQLQPDEVPDWMAHIGFGLPNSERATTNDPFRVTYITSGLDRIKAGEVQAWTIPIHENIRRDHDVLVRIDVTTCCCPAPRPTRRGRKYGSLWVDWKASSRGQDIGAFLQKQSYDAEAPEDAEEGSSLQWTLGPQERQGVIKNVTGSAGSTHRDWAIIPADELPRDMFGIAVRGHKGWDEHPDSSVPYALAVTFTVLGQKIPIYALQAQAQTQVSLQAEIAVRVPE